MSEPGGVTLTIVGHSAPREALAEKARGAVRYTADLKRPGMLYGRILRSPHAHARIASIDVSAAGRMSGVHAVLTHRDVPDTRIDADLRVLDPHLRFVGDEVAAVAAESPGAAEDALEAIRVEYEPLPVVLEVDDALAPGAPAVHEGGNLVDGKRIALERGDVQQGFAAAQRVFEGTFRTAAHAPGGMETRSALAEWDGDRLTVHKTSRSVHAHDRQALSRVLGLPLENVRVLCTAMGGGFGNKDEGRIGPLAALLARKAGRPVRLDYDRAEEFVAGRSRQGIVSHLRIGVGADGAPTAIEMHSEMNAGAHVASGRNVARRIGQGALYLYACANARYEGASVYTNRPPGGSFRGLGAPAGHFALEVLVDQIAEALGVDPLDYRLAHHVPPEGQPGTRTTPPGQLLPDEPVEGGVPFSGHALRACLLAGAERIGWRERRQPNGSAQGLRRRGLGVAMGIYKGGVGRESNADVRVTPQGRVEVRVGVVDVGQGSATILAQMAAEALGAPLEAVDMVMADTADTPPGHITAGSSTTFSSGHAVKLAAETARNRLLERAAAALGVTDVTLEGGRFVVPGASPRTVPFAQVCAALGEPVVGEASITPGSTERIINAFSAHFAEVEVEMDTGRIRLLRYVAAQDAGRVINPRLAEGQVSGGVLQFLGIALREELLVDPATGVTLNPSFLEHKGTAIVDFPPIEVLFAPDEEPLGAFGAKGLGEPPVVPVYAAVANAVANATGVWLHDAPFTPRRVLEAIHAQGGSR